MRWTRRRILVVLMCVLAASFLPTCVFGQAGESDLKVYGYLQASLFYDSDDEGTSSFTIQQLNLLFQKNLRRRWSTFVDFLFTNNYSSFRNEGTFDLQQAWVRYRKDRYLIATAGLLIPKFNRLNEIRNKMPVLPYVVRPIVYETSFQEDIDIHEYVPQQAYLQIEGHAPVGDYKIEYAGYTGNSPNVNRDPSRGQTGLDTSNSFLWGGRVGVRHSYFQVGVSATHDQLDHLDSHTVLDTLTPPIVFEDISRVRLGADASFEYENVWLEAEFIGVTYTDDGPLPDLDKRFYYGTLGYRFMERLATYVSYWKLDQRVAIREANGFQGAEIELKIPNGGVAYQMSDRITFKGAVAYVDRVISIPGLPVSSFYFYTVAVSVMF